jgi:tRNA-binding protein
MAKPEITWDDFDRVEMTVGRIREVQPFERARRPTYKVLVDFGDERGRRWSSVQARADYTEEELLGRLVVAVTNFPPKNIAGFMSEVLILGVPAPDGGLSLLEPSRGAVVGSSVY